MEENRKKSTDCLEKTVIRIQILKVLPVKAQQDMNILFETEEKIFIIL